LLFSDGGAVVVTSTAEERRDVRGSDSGADSRQLEEPAAVGADRNGESRLN
jgi:3-oxoacyl-[acyl-carrier-protein] synthase III